MSAKQFAKLIKIYTALGCVRDGARTRRATLVEFMREIADGNLIVSRRGVVR